MLLALLSGIASETHAQKFRNRGTIVSTGTIAVRDSLIGLPPSIGGLVRLTGGAQLVPASQYDDLDLVSPAVTTKQAAGSLTILKNLNIGPNVTLQVPADSVIVLGMANGRLTEQGYISGMIKKSVDLIGINDSSDFGGIGVSVSWAGTAPGLTTITRTSGTAVAAAGKNSIKRYVDVAAASVSTTNLSFSYSTDELQGQDPSSLDLWRLPAGDTQWRRQRVTRSGNVLTKVGVVADGRFTAADVANPLNSITKYEYEADVIASAGVDSSSGKRGAFVDSVFIARIVDAFGQPVSGVRVDFAVTSKPAGSTSDSLTVQTALSGIDGTATTHLRLGDAVGSYVVTATAPLEPSVPPKTWIGYTEQAVWAMTISSGNGQSDTVRAVLSTPLAVRLSDSLGAAVAGSSVRFRIISTPLGGADAALSDSIAISNGSGIAGTGIVLGSKVGTYVIEARSLEVDSLVTVVAVTATHGAPTGFTIFASGQQDTVLNQLSPYGVTIADTYGNAVPGIPVQFALSSIPVGSAGAVLSDSSGVTDSAGTTTTRLTLGDRTGMYVVQATSTSLPGVTRSFTSTAVASSPTVLALVQGASQRKQVQLTADTTLAVRALDAFGNAVPGVVVDFSLVSAPSGSTGQSFAASDTTDSLGIAQTTFTVGTKVGAYVVQASASSISGSLVSFEVTGTNGPAASFQFLVSSAQGVVNTMLTPFTVALLDANGNAVPSAMVRFSIAGAPAGAVGQSITPDSVATDSAGTASVTLTLGDRTGLYSLTAQAAGFAGPTPSLTVTATPAQVAQMVGTQGIVQQTTILSLVDTAFVVRVLDSLGNPVGGVPVQFAIVGVPSGAVSQSLTATVDTSDATGLAQSRLQLGTKIGHYVVAATTPALSGTQVLFDVLATHGTAANVLTAAPVTQDTVARQLTPFTVAVVDAFDNPVPNATVRFSVVAAPAGASGYALDVAVGVTDSSGQAFVRLTLGDKVGSYDVSAVADQLPTSARTFRATAIAAGASSLARQLGDGQQEQILTPLANAFVARVADRFGNPVSGVAVRFAVVDSPSTAAGQSLSRLVDTTDALGQASTILRLGLKVGVYTVEADAQGMPPVRFTAQARPGAPKTMAGLVTDSLAFVSSELAPFVITVRDTGNNLVPNAVVTFSIAETPAGAVGTSLSTVTALTDSLGRASTNLRVGDRVGRYGVLSEVNGVQGITIVVEARALIGNANFDMRIDIGDLTAIIDHILGRTILTGRQFQAGDVDTNGVIDLRDAVIARNYLLSGGVWNVADTLLNPVLFSAFRDDRATTPAVPLADAAMGSHGDAGVTGDPVNTTTVLEHTNIGIRVNLANDVPVKGVQVYLRSKRPIKALESDIRFGRARGMNIVLAATDHEVRALVFNFQNSPIDSGMGPIFRIPIAGLDTTDVDSVAVIVSTGVGNLSTLIDQQQVLKTVGNYPTTFSLYQNYPNPFNSETFIEYDVPEVAGRIPRVAIQIFNIIGEKVRTIDREDRDAGRYKIRWDGRDQNGATVATGVYFYRLLSVDPVEGKHVATTKKMIMVK